MQAARIIYRCTLLSGCFLLLLVLLHATLGFNEILLGVKTGAINKDYSQSVKINWIFSSVSMFLISCWILFLSKDLRLLQRRAWWQGIIASGGLIFLGCTGIYLDHDTYFFLVFILCGLILFVPLILYAFKFRNSIQKLL
jgi:uncharacterized membrane protein YqgA involved in biofilm formation